MSFLRLCKNYKFMNKKNVWKDSIEWWMEKLEEDLFKQDAIRIFESATGKLNFIDFFALCT